jgi:hypothetical protein
MTESLKVPKEQFEAVIKALLSTPAPPGCVMQLHRSRYLSNRFPKGLLKPLPGAPAGARTAPRASGAITPSPDTKGACSGLSGAGTGLATVGTQQGQCSEQKMPASLMGECIGEVLPPHLQHGGLMSTDRQHCDGPVVGTNLDRFRSPVGCGPTCFRIFGVFIIRFAESRIGFPRWCGASRVCISRGFRLTGHTRIAYFLRPDCLTVGQ